MITSKQNSLIKEIRSLADKKFRDRLNLFVIEGVKPVKEALSLNIPLYAVIGTGEVLSQLCLNGVRVEEVSDEVLKYVSEEVTPQGVIAVAFKPENLLTAPKGKCLFLDGVADPSNVGAIIRTAAALGYNQIYMTDDCADPYSQKAVRSSMTGVLRVQIIRAERQALMQLINLPVIVADMNGQDLSTFTIDEDFCLVIGNEGRGVSNLLRERANFTVCIPMQNGVESLNAAVSAAILMYGIK